jgi:Ni,Fe-hydrogenase III component G
MARLMLEIEVRWVTLTVSPAAEGGFRLLYHWDLDGSLLTIAVSVPGTRAETVSDICPAADWAEREARDYYALEFAGRKGMPTLMLRPEDDPGLFSRTSELGRHEDPADSARLDGGGDAQ